MPKTKPKKAAAPKPKASAKKAAKPVAKKATKPAAKKPAEKKPAKSAPAAKAPAKAAKAQAKPSKAPAKAAKTPAKAPSPTKKDPQTAAKVNGRPPQKPVKQTPFMKLQRERLIVLRDTILDSMAGVARDTLRSRPEGSEASAFGMHQADAGSDAYDKDFALSLLSQEQDALYEIEEALKRIENGTYGICEMSGKPIPHARLEALPFARLTVECQAEVERTKRILRARTPVTSLFGLTDSESESDDDGEEAEEQPAKQQQSEE